MKRTIEVNHLARVEGHGGIIVELENDRVSDVRFEIFEGARLVESLLRGRRCEDVAQIVSRICAICSVAHSLTSLKATEAAFGIVPSEQTQRLRDLMYRGENIESHSLHLFLLALPDYLGYPSAAAMVEKHGDAVAMGLRLKKLGNAIQETLGGRAIHPVNAVVGGFGTLPTTRQLVALKEALETAQEDCERMIELMAGLPATPFVDADIAFAALRSSAWYGYYRGDLIDLQAGQESRTFAAADYRALTNEEVVRHAHAKHSRFRGHPFMVGALARLAINGALLRSRALAAMQQLDLRPPFRNPMDNNKAQAVELVNDVDAALATVEDVLHTGVADEGRPSVQPREGTGIAVTEAPRGLLVHSYTYDAGGHITRADVITPTAANAASIEDHFRDAVARSKGGDHIARTLEMIARAYDPCISCSVHVVRKDHVA